MRDGEKRLVGTQPVIERVLTFLAGTMHQLSSVQVSNTLAVLTGVLSDHAEAALSSQEKDAISRALRATKDLAAAIDKARSDIRAAARDLGEHDLDRWRKRRKPGGNM